VLAPEEVDVELEAATEEADDRVAPLLFEAPVEVCDPEEPAVLAEELVAAVDAVAVELDPAWPEEHPLISASAPTMQSER
jgi:hypothetical protein